MHSEQLIMDLGKEQGPSRETQVQMPIDVWRRYFGFDPLTLPRSHRPTILLVNRRIRTPDVEPRPVSIKDHNATLEIAGAGTRRPAILRMKRNGDPAEHRYDYWVMRPGDDEYEHYDWVLTEFRNDLCRSDRRWIII
jgi:hypothetical protein